MNILTLPPRKVTARLEQMPAGIAVSSARGGGRVQVLTRTLVTSDDGPHLYVYLDGLFGSTFAPLLGGFPIESVRSVLVKAMALV